MEDWMSVLMVSGERYVTLVSTRTAEEVSAESLATITWISLVVIPYMVKKEVALYGHDSSHVILCHAS